MKKPITCSEAGRKGGKARSAAKTASNRKNAAQPRFQPRVGMVWCYTGYQTLFTIKKINKTSSFLWTCDEGEGESSGRDAIASWIADRKAGLITIVRPRKKKPAKLTGKIYASVADLVAGKIVRKGGK